MCIFTERAAKRGQLEYQVALRTQRHILGYDWLLGGSDPSRIPNLTGTRRTSMCDDELDDPRTWAD